ncbi:MAG: hypothetical protein AAF514_18980 [Verrucomicrobiota bacterium]
MAVSTGALKARARAASGFTRSPGITEQLLAQTIISARQRRKDISTRATREFIRNNPLAKAKEQPFAPSIGEVLLLLIRDGRLSILAAALDLSEQKLKAAEAKAEALALANSKLKDQIDRLHSE